MREKITTSVNLSKLEKDRLKELAKIFAISQSDALRMGLWIILERHLANDDYKNIIEYHIEDVTKGIFENDILAIKQSIKKLEADVQNIIDGVK